MSNMIKCALQFDKVFKKINEIYKHLRLKLNNWINNNNNNNNNNSNNNNYKVNNKYLTN